MSKATLEERKEKALKLDIFKPYINKFRSGNHVCYYENFAGFWAWQDQELCEKVKEIESKYNCTVYAVTHELTEFGELYDLIVVPEHKEDWEYLLQPTERKDKFYTFAYVWNKDDDICSEFGDICIQSFGGGLKRVG